MPPDPLSVPALLERAQARCGVEEPGPPAGLDNLGRLVASWRETGGLSPAGVQVLEKVLVRHLVNGLRLASWPTPTRMPDVAVVVTGLPRTGTTLVHRLLALDPGWRVLALWEALSPVPGTTPLPPRAERIAAAETWLARYLELAPEMRAIHALSAEGPEECDALMQNVFASQHLDDMVNAPAYSDWLYRADLGAEYAAHARQLAAIDSIAAEDAGRPWVLKSPSHLAHLQELLTVYPGALVVHCHREPSQAISSWASLVGAVRRPHAERVEPGEVGAQCLARAALATDRAMALRQAGRDGSFFDLSYRALVVDPLATIRAIYSRLGRVLSGQVEAAMAAWVLDNPQHKHGRHHHELSAFGLDSNRVGEALAPYVERFSWAWS